VNCSPAGWTTARLNEIAEVKLGRQRSPKNHTGDRMRPYLRAANVSWRGLELSDVKEMNFTEEESQVFELRPGDIVVGEASGSRSEVGKPAIWRGEIPECCFQNTLLRVRATQGAVTPEYLLYFLRAEALSGRLGDAARGVGIHHIGAARMSSWMTPVPPPAEQRRIVAVIEEQFSRLDAAEASLRSAARTIGALRSSLLSTGTTGHRMVELGTLITDLRYGTSIKCSYEAEGAPVLRIPNVRNGRIDRSDLKFATDPNADLSSFELRHGDLLFVRTNGSRELIGRVAWVDGAEGMAFASYLIRARPNTSHLDPRYAAIALSAPPMRVLIESKAATTAGQYNLNLAALRSIPVPLPAMEDQRRIVTEVDRQMSSLDSLDATVRRARVRSEALRRSILERAFSGQLVPQDPADEPASAVVERVGAERSATNRSRRRARRVEA
jgi:type I restriction enzyme S subunit